MVILKKKSTWNLPPGFNAPEGYVWKLKKAVYGLKQAGREWYKRIRKEFEGLGFTRSQADHCIFYKVEDGMLLIIAIYVDDMILLSDKSEGIRRLLLIEDKLCEIFEMTNLGDPKWLLSMEVERDRAARTISICQRQHIENVLEQHGMQSCRPVSTPGYQKSPACISLGPNSYPLASVVFNLLV